MISRFLIMFKNYSYKLNNLIMYIYLYFRALRYEELALSPNSTSYDLLKFLRLGITQSVDEFLHSHTNVEVAGVSSTFRVSRDVPFRWKNVLDFDYVDEIQVKFNYFICFFVIIEANNVYLV